MNNIAQSKRKVRQSYYTYEDRLHINPKSELYSSLIKWNNELLNIIFISKIFNKINQKSYFLASKIFINKIDYDEYMFVSGELYLD